MSDKSFQHVSNLWNDAEAAKLDPVARLIYRSNKLGADLRVTNTGGGNTSAKLAETDPLTGQKAEVLWVKLPGSGGDLRTSTKENFSSLYQDRLISLQKVYACAERGPKTPAEDEMAAMHNHCTFTPTRAPRRSILPPPFYSGETRRSHPPKRGDFRGRLRPLGELTKEIYGDEVVHTPWLRPGFELGLVMQDICRKHPNARGIMMGQHGLINWANDDRDCYFTSLELIERAARFIEKNTPTKAETPPRLAANSTPPCPNRCAAKSSHASCHGCAAR